MEIRGEIEAVLQAHAAWREHFKDILSGRTKFDLSEIRATDKCFFGQWLEKEGKRLVAPELHAEISAVHEKFHRLAAEIIQKIREKNFTEARNDIALDGALNLTSLQLKSLVVKIKFHEPTKDATLQSDEDRSLAPQKSE